MLGAPRTRLRSAAAQGGPCAHSELQQRRESQGGVAQRPAVPQVFDVGLAFPLLTAAGQLNRSAHNVELGFVRFGAAFFYMMQPASQFMPSKSSF